MTRRRTERTQLLLPAVALGAVLLAAPAALAAQDITAPGEAGARAAAEAYFRSHATGDASHIRPVFHDVSQLMFVRDGELTTVTGEEYMGRMTGEAPGNESERERRIVLVDVTGTAGVVKVELDYPNVVFTDYLSLLRVDGRWQVVNKTFHAEPR